VLAAPAAGLSDDVLLVAVGPFATMALAVAELLRNQGIGVTVVDPRWVLPVPESIGELAQSHKLVVTLEDNGVHGGVGSSASADCAAPRLTCRVATSGCRTSSRRRRRAARFSPMSA
jgi:1-deoxy-D-xylulose-5-phosphate synthase